MQDNERECNRCGQRAVLVHAEHKVFGHPMFFGEKDEWAFIPQAGDTYLCGTCALDQKDTFELHEYGIEKVSLGRMEYAYRKVRKPQPIVSVSYQDIPPEYRGATLSKVPYTAEDKIRNWYNGGVAQICIFGNATRAAWAIFRKAQLEHIGAEFWPMTELMSRIRLEENSGGTYAGSKTVKLLQRANGIVIIHDVAGVNMTKSRAEWVSAILDERYDYKRKTVITILQTEESIPGVIVNRFTRGVVTGVCAWGCGMVNEEYRPRGEP